MSKFIMVGAPGSGTRWMRRIIKDLFKTEVTYNFKSRDIVSSEHQTYKIPQALKEGFKTIHLIRDGRSQIQSRILAGHGFDDGIIKEFNLKVPDVKHINYAITWNKFVELGMQGRGNKNYIEIKYEDFCLKPATTIDKISKFLKLGFDKSKIENIRKNINPSLGKYNNFSLEELKSIKDIIKENMDKLGYNMEE